MSNDLCKKCFFYGEPRCSYQYNVKRDVDICKYFKAIPQTLFDRITANEETLAKELVYALYGMYGKTVIAYFSTIIPGKSWKVESEAIAATVAKLKEVEK